MDVAPQGPGGRLAARERREENRGEKQNRRQDETQRRRKIHSAERRSTRSAKAHGSCQRSRRSGAAFCGTVAWSHDGTRDASAART